MSNAQKAAAVLFSGSFLLFLVQPLLGRTLLPVFGGSAAVWTVCLAAYQVLLLAGYLYAHVIVRLPMARQRRLHIGVLALAACWTALFAASRGWVLSHFGSSEWPAIETLLCVLMVAGLPYTLLSAGSTLVQAWVARNGSGTQITGRSVYSLYAVSNFGSFAGLLIFPFLLEPFVALTWHWWFLAAGLALYAVALARLRVSTATSSAAIPPNIPQVAYRIEWFLLPGVSAFLVNAVIAHLFADVTPLPLIWVVMLSAFLLSYVVGFSIGAGRWRMLWSLLTLVSILWAAKANGVWGAGSFYPNAVAGAAVLLFGGATLHGWLFEVRPGTTSLTRFYLAIAAGGALGGVLAALVAPLVFKRVLEYPVALCVVTLLTVWRLCGLLPRWRHAYGVRAALALGCTGATLFLLLALARKSSAREIYAERNFYHPVRVTETLEQLGGGVVVPVHYLWCGQTTHGLQVMLSGFDQRDTSYYSAVGGGVAFASHTKRRMGVPIKVAVVGLGAGCLASYGEAGDLFRFHEINPLMFKVATDMRLFTFLPDAPMAIDLVPGDARLSLEQERAAHDPRYDILVIDAYSGDAVPYQLATLEAFKLYFDRLESDGILAVHVSNWHIDLLPLCKAAAEALGVQIYGLLSNSDSALTADALWVFMSRSAVAYSVPQRASVHEVVWEKVRKITMPTDERGSLLALLR